MSISLKHGSTPGMSLLIVPLHDHTHQSRIGLFAPIWDEAFHNNSSGSPAVRISRAISDDGKRSLKKIGPVVVKSLG